MPEADQSAGPSVVSTAVLTLAFFALVGGGVLALSRVQTALVVATLALAGVIIVFWLAAVGWGYLAGRDAMGTTAPTASAPTVPSLSPAMTAATSLAIQVQGVVLGLVFAFSHQDSVVVKVGVVALAVGIVVGLLLYGLTAFEVTGQRTLSAAVILFDLTLFALAYGLLCLVTAFLT